MGVIGALIGAASSIYGGWKASQAMKNIQDNIEKQQQSNKDWFDRRYNEDATQRADAQRILQMTEESIKNRNKQAAGTAAVMGSTNESVAAANKAIADATSTIAANAEARKDRIEATYLQNDNYNEQLNNIEKEKADAIAQAVQGTTQAVSSINF